MKFIFIISIFVLFSCGDISKDETGKLNQPCYDNGNCNGSLVCNINNICRNDDNCKDINCSNRGKCIIKETVATCNCKEGYHDDNLQCIRD